jgi:hypothetical protein
LIRLLEASPSDHAASQQLQDLLQTAPQKTMRGVGAARQRGPSIAGHGRFGRGAAISTYQHYNLWCKDEFYR